MFERRKYFCKYYVGHQVFVIVCRKERESLKKKIVVGQDSGICKISKQKLWC